MSRVGRISRAYARVQQIVSEYLNRGYNPTTREIQLAYYGDRFSDDSKIQYDTIYQCICKGRESAIAKWEAYISSREFESDLQKVLTTHDEERENAVNSHEWKEFYDRLIENGEIPEELLPLLPALEFLFEQKMYQFSEEGTNFVIPEGNPFLRTTRWYRPSRAAWNIREEDIYKRTLRVMGTQFRRGIKTQVRLGSGLPLRRVLDYTRTIKAALEDVTSWNCPYCGALNLGEDERCIICRTPRT